MSDTIFPAAVAATLAWEGGYADDPADPGGETNFGISKRSYPHVDIAALTREEAIGIYRRDFWQKPGFQVLPDRIGAKVFDLGVNMGTATAVKLLQRACNRVTGTEMLVIDGVMGAKTTQRANAVSVVELLLCLRNEAANHYAELAALHPALRRFLAGWLRRAAS